MENENKPIEYDDKENKSYGCIWLMIGIAILALVLGLVLGLNNSDTSKSSLTKKPPDIEIESTLTGLLFNIQANDDYKYIIFNIELLDKDLSVAKTFTMRENDLKKGELRQASYKFSIGEFFESRYVQVQIKEYK